MQLDSLTYHTESQGGYTVQAADYNSEYHLWFNPDDPGTYYLYDSIDNDVTAVPKAQLQSWIDQGLLDDTGTDINAAGNNPQVNNNGNLQLPQTGTDWVKTLFIGAAVIMAIYLIKQ